jgi:hypothetical protein
MYRIITGLVLVGLLLVQAGCGGGDSTPPRPAPPVQPAGPAAPPAPAAPAPAAPAPAAPAPAATPAANQPQPTPEPPPETPSDAVPPGGQPATTPAATQPGAAAMGSAPAGTAAQEPSAPIDESFTGLAKAALAQGRETQGIAYLAADAVVSGNEEVLGSLRWSAALKRPIVALRWGLATLVVQPAKPSESKSSTRSEGASGGSSSPISIPPGNIFGGGAVGGLATVQPVVPPPTPAPAPTPPASTGRPAKKRPGETAPDTKTADYSIPDPIGFWRQNVGAPLVEALQTRLNRGDFGNWLKDSDKRVAGNTAAAASPAGSTPGQDDPLASQPPQAVPASQTPTNQAAAPLLSAAPGMTLLEGSSLSDLRANALRENLDFVMFASLSSKAIRNGPAQTVIEIHIVDLCKGGDDWVSKPQVNHVRVMAAQQATGKEKDKQENPLPALLKTVQLHIDRQCQLLEMPRIEHEAALKRAAALTAAKAKNPLPALLELRYYQWKKALSDQEFADFAAKIAGAEDSQRLATGTDAERKQVVDQWLGAARKE